MADTLTISLDGPLADYVRAAAAARGLSPEDYVCERLAARIAADKAAKTDLAETKANSVCPDSA